MMKQKKLLIVSVLLVLAVFCSRAQKVAIKTNIPYLATSTPNLAIEVATGDKHSFSIGGGWQPWQFSDTKKLKHWLVQPELRYWTCETFNGHFFGIHALGGQFNAGGIKLPFGLFPSLRDNRYQGWAAGGGLSYGYQWVMSPRWNFELSVGVGYLYVDYKKYDCLECGKPVEKSHYNYIGPTKAAISLIYCL